MLKRALAGGALAASGSILPRVADASESRFASAKPVFSNDAYTSLIPAAIGGPMIANPHMISLRWLGCSSYELVHRGKVYLLDAWFDRGPRTRPVGFGQADVVRAETIIIGHGHFDHIADAPPIAARTEGTIAYLFTFDSGYRMVALGPFTPDETTAFLAMLARGTGDPRVLTEGTIAYLFTFDSGYRMVWLDSGGPITPQMISAMNRVGKTNLAIASYTVQGIPDTQIPVTMNLIDLFQPDVYLPCHHDEIVLIPLRNGLPDMATEPLLMAIRDTMPTTRAIAPLYRSPIVVNTKNGRVVEARSEGGDNDDDG